MVAEQKKLLEMLKEIDAICRKHDIEYYLAGGTCIGAIRHKGFLPWDDDMDLYMTRKNWEKFMEVSKYDFPPNRVLLCQELVESYSNMFGRYCDTSTTALHKHNMYPEENGDDPCGVIVDILPLDPIPYTKEFLDEYTQKLMIYSQLIMPTGGYVHRHPINPFRYLKYEIRYLFNRRKVLDELFGELFCYDEEDCDYFAMRWGGTPLLFPKEWFLKPTEYQFEDMKAMMPTMNNAYLTMHYGDSWTDVPNMTERAGHVAIFREDKPYESFRAMYEPLVKHRRRIYVKLFHVAFHFIRLLFFKRNEKRDRKNLHREGQRVLDTIGCQSGKELERLWSLLEQREMAKIEPVIKPYLDQQLNTRYIGREDFGGIMRFHHPVLLEVSEDFFTYAVLYCMYSNRIHWALRLMEIKEGQSTLSEKLAEWKEDILLFRSAVNDYDLKRYEDSLDKARRLAEKHPGWDALLKLRLRLYLYCGVGETEEAESLLKTAGEIYPENGEFLRYRLDFDRKNGRSPDWETMIEQNYRAITTTKNGMIHLAIREEMDDCFVDFIGRIEKYRDEKDFRSAAEWMEKGKAIYLDEKLEQLLILEEELAFLSCEGKEGVLPEQIAEEQAAVIKRVEDSFENSNEGKEGWKKLYIKLLLRCGYGQWAAGVMAKLLECGSYAETEAMGSLLEGAEDSTGGKMACAEYYYALGKTLEANRWYREVIGESAASSVIGYQAKSRLGIRKIIR